MKKRLKKNIVATIKSWNIENFKRLKAEDVDHEWILIDRREDLIPDKIKEISPGYIFFPHWSWRVSPDIYQTCKCVVFHMTDLPFGRGGSPLQNLISRGIYQTKVSAIEMVESYDAGGIYMKQSLDISSGSAGEILKNVSDISFSMIRRIVKDTPRPIPQSGKPVYFKRREAQESEIPLDIDLPKLNDWIRMLDGEGYPRAFLDYGNLKIEFENGELHGHQLIARARITKGNKNE